LRGIAVGVSGISVGLGVGAADRTHALNKRMIEAIKIDRFILFSVEDYISSGTVLVRTRGIEILIWIFDL
jgi:hypothetical protein